MKKILILTWTPFFKSDYKKYDLHTLEKKNKIFIFDISRIVYKNFNIDNIYKKNDRIKVHNYFKVKELIKDLKNINIDLVINATGLEKKNPIIDVILKKDVKIISIYDYKNFESFFFSKKIVFYIKYIIKTFQIFFCPKNLNEIAFMCSKNIDNQVVSLGKKIFYSHSFAYDYFLREKKKLLSKKKTVAYIDSGFGFHPDFFVTRGINKKFKINSYSKKINNLFKNFKDLGYEINFLSHPKVDIKNQKIYKNCKIVNNNTYKYIKSSEIVIVTSSSVIDLAIIHKKKILRVFANEMNSYPENIKDFKAASKFFNNKFLNLDQSLDIKRDIFNDIMMPGKLYQKYFDSYIKHPHSNDIKFSKLIDSFLN